MVMTSASHAEGREFESRLEYFFCQFMKLHARGTLLPYREVRRARVYSRYENSPRPASSTGARRRRVAGEEALCGRTAWSAARSSSARPHRRARVASNRGTSPVSASGPRPRTGLHAQQAALAVTVQASGYFPGPVRMPRNRGKASSNFVPSTSERRGSSPRFSWLPPIAQLVERLLSMRKVMSSILIISKTKLWHSPHEILFRAGFSFHRRARVAWVV